MKKYFISLFMLVFTILCLPTCAFAVTDFYAMEVDEDDGGLVGEKLYTVNLKADQTIFLVFFSGDEPIDKEELKIEGLYRDTDAEDEAIDDILHSNKTMKSYEYEDNLICIDGFLNYEEVHQISYEDYSVKFELAGLYYKLITDKGSDSWYERQNKYYVLRDFYDQPYLYVRFYYDEILLNVKSLSFIDKKGQVIDDSIISGDYDSKETNAWKISYTDNVDGNLNLSLNIGNEIYTIPVELRHFYAGFCNIEDDEIERIIYKKGEKETFYLFYNYLDGVDISKITEIDNADKVDFVEDSNGKIKFTIKECQTPYTYSIKVNDKECEIEILPPEYSFHAKKITIDEVAGTYIVGNDILNKIGLKKKETQYFVFYNENELMKLSNGIIREAKDEYININLSENSIFKSSAFEGYVYEIEALKLSNIMYTIEYKNQEIEIAKAEDTVNVAFYKYIKTNKVESFTTISEFVYEKGTSEVFYLYSESGTLQVSDLVIKDISPNIVTFNDEILNVKGNNLNVIKVTITNYVEKFSLRIDVNKWNTSARIDITSQEDLLPLKGFYLDYQNRTEDTFIGDENNQKTLDYVYVSGDVFYYICEEEDEYISSGDLIAKTTLPLDIEYIKTGTITLQTGGTDDRYAIKFTVPVGTRGSYINENIRVYYTGKKGIQSQLVITVTLDDAYEKASVGVENVEYGDKEYDVGFVSGDAEILSHYKNSYPMIEEGKTYTHTVKIPIKIFEVVSGNVADEYIEMPDLYNNVDSLDVFVAMYNPYKDKYEKITNDVSDYISVTTQRETNGFERWYIELNYSNLPAEYWLVANLTMDEGNDVTFAMKYDSQKVIEDTLDLSTNTTWKIAEINEFIENDMPNANVINIKLNPNVAYGTNGDATELNLQGDKAIYIDGNGATIVGRVMIDIPKDARSAPLHQLTNIHFLSESSRTSGDSNNVCIDGLGQARITKCTFENYHIAVNMYPTEQRKGDIYGVKNATDFCTFKNNKYGIYIDGKDEERLFEETSSEIINCKFIGNNEGIHIVEQEALQKAEDILRIYHSEFIDNTYDIVNRNGVTKYLAYGCLFAVISNEPGETIKIRKPQTVEILVSYVYREHFLNTDSNGFIDGKDVASKVAYAPLDAEGKLDDFIYQNLHNIGVNVANFIGEINVIGNYDMTQKEYIQYGIWKFSK